MCDRGFWAPKLSFVRIYAFSNAGTESGDFFLDSLAAESMILPLRSAREILSLARVDFRYAQTNRGIHGKNNFFSFTSQYSESIAVEESQISLAPVHFVLDFIIEITWCIEFF